MAETEDKVADVSAIDPWGAPAPGYAEVPAQVKGAKVDGSAHDPLETQGMMDMKARQTMGADTSEEAVEARTQDLEKAKAYALQLSREGFSFEDIVAMVGAQFLTVPLENIRQTVERAQAQHEQAHKPETDYRPDVSAAIPVMPVMAAAAAETSEEKQDPEREAELARQQALEAARRQHDAAVASATGLMESEMQGAELVKAMQKLYPGMEEADILRVCAEAKQGLEQKKQQEQETRKTPIEMSEPAKSAPAKSSFKDSVVQFCEEVSNVARSAMQRVSKFLSPGAKQESAAIAREMMDNGAVTGVGDVSAAQLAQAMAPNITPNLAKQAIRGMSAN